MPNTNRVHRQLVCLPRGEGKVLLSWRLLPTDRADAPFQVERRREASDTWVRVSEIPVTDSTTLLDRVPEPRRYEYRVVGDGVSEVVSVDAGAAPDIVALSIPLDPEMFSGWGLLMALGELCNDGRIGYIVRGARGGRLWILAYDHDGQLRWERNTYLPPGENGDAYHVPLLCWDVNADGRSEVVFYTGQPDDPREHYGVPEVGQCLTAVDGETGEVVWEAPSLMVADAMTVGHLRGIDQAASVVVQERTYADVTLTAYDGRTGAVSWQVDQARPAGHALDIADIDEDGVQEVICGGVCYRGDGTVKWEAEQFGHADISKPARIDPSRPGMQVWYAIENGNTGVYLVDKDGNTIFKEFFHHAHYGWVCRHTAEVPGLQPHTAEDARYEADATQRGIVREDGHFPIFLPDGTHWANLTDWQRKNFIPVHWCEGPEVAFAIRKENHRIVRFHQDGSMEDVPEGKLPKSGRYGRNLCCADILGDYREEIVALDDERHRVMVLTNPTPADSRQCSPYEDFEYRHDRSQHGSGYYIYLSPPFGASYQR